MCNFANWPKEQIREAIFEFLDRLETKEEYEQMLIMLSDVKSGVVFECIDSYLDNAVNTAKTEEEWYKATRIIRWNMEGAIHLIKIG